MPLSAPVMWMHNVEGGGCETSGDHFDYRILGQKASLTVHAGQLKIILTGTEEESRFVFQTTEIDLLSAHVYEKT